MFVSIVHITTLRNTLLTLLYNPYTTTRSAIIYLDRPTPPSLRTPHTMFTESRIPTKPRTPRAPIKLSHGATTTRSRTSVTTRALDFDDPRNTLGSQDESEDLKKAKKNYEELIGKIEYLWNYRDTWPYGYETDCHNTLLNIKDRCHDFRIQFGHFVADVTLNYVDNKLKSGFFSPVPKEHEVTTPMPVSTLNFQCDTVSENHLFEDRPTGSMGLNVEEFVDCDRYIDLGSDE